MGWRSCQAQISRVRTLMDRIVGPAAILGSGGPEGVGLSQSTIRARVAQEEVRGQRRIRVRAITVEDVSHRPSRDHCRWTTFTRGRSRGYVGSIYASSGLAARFGS